MKILVQVDKTITWLPDGSVALLNVFQWIERKRERERGVFMLIWERIRADFVLSCLQDMQVLLHVLSWAIMYYFQC